MIACGATNLARHIVWGLGAAVVAKVNRTGFLNLDSAVLVMIRSFCSLSSKDAFISYPSRESLVCSTAASKSAHVGGQLCLLTTEFVLPVCIRAG